MLWLSRSKCLQRHFRRCVRFRQGLHTLIRHVQRFAWISYRLPHHPVRPRQFEGVLQSKQVLHIQVSITNFGIPGYLLYLHSPTIYGVPLNNHVADVSKRYQLSSAETIAHKHEWIQIQYREYRALHFVAACNRLQHSPSFGRN